MARRTRSFLFDNISKRLVQNTNKTAREINSRKAANTVANTDILTSSETDTKISTTISNTGINTLSDISIANVVSDQVLQYNANTGNWENETLTLVSSVDGLTDTSISSVQRDDYLKYDGSNWINSALDLSSYATTTYVDDQVANVSVDLSSYSTTTQMNTAIASSNTAMKNYVDAEVAGVVNSAPSTLDTLNELAAALGDDPDFATTTATNIGTKLAKSSNLSDLTNAATARTNLGLGTAAITASTDYATSAQGTKADTAHGWGNHASAGYGTSNFSGAYADLTGKPTIPTNNNQLTNGAGYITTAFINDEGSYTGDLDNLTASSDQGFYHWGSTQPTNSPGWNYGGLFVVRDNNQNLQLAIGNSGNGSQRLAIRRADSGSYSGNAWTEFWSTADFSSTKISNWDTAYGWGNHASAGYSTFSGSYNDLSNKPTIPTNNNQLTNGAGYITSADGGNADTVDGIHAASFLRSDADDTVAAGVTYSWAATNTAGLVFTNTSYAKSLHIGGWSSSNSAGISRIRNSNDNLHIDAGANGHIYLNHYCTGNVYIRGSTAWHAGNDGSGSGLDADLLDGQHGSYYSNYNNLSNKPTIPTNNNQLTNGAGYITNSGGTTAATASTVAKRNGSGDINARLFRSSYANQSTISGAIAYRVNTSDNYIRFCSDGAAIRSFIGAGTSNFNGAYSSLSGRPTLGGGTPYLDLSTANYGTVKVDDDRGVTWAGYTIRDDWSLMSNGAAQCGMYDDTDNVWMQRWYRGGTTELYWDGSWKLQTDSAGVAINGRVSASGDSTFTQSTHGPYHGSSTSGNVTSLEILNNGGTGDSRLAAMSFHCSSYYGLHMHLRSDSYFGIGGWSASAWRWYVQASTGNMTAAGNVTAYSDPRLKENITPLTGAVEKIKKLNGMEFTWKDLPDVVGTPGARDYGVLSTEVAEVAPHAIHESPHTAPEGDTYKTVAYDKLIPLLIEAVKEQQKEIDELKAKLA